LYVKIEDVERDVTTLVRTIALRDQGTTDSRGTTETKGTKL
jgi:hypothetical protein